MRLLRPCLSVSRVRQTEPAERATPAVRPARKNQRIGVLLRAADLGPNCSSALRRQRLGQGASRRMRNGLPPTVRVRELYTDRRIRSTPAGSRGDIFSYRLSHRPSSPLRKIGDGPRCDRKSSRTRSSRKCPIQRPLLPCGADVAPGRPQAQPEPFQHRPWPARAR